MELGVRPCRSTYEAEGEGRHGVTPMHIEKRALASTPEQDLEVPDRQCPGWGSLYLGRGCESPELVFVRSLDMET
jgi:hypothetical protein